MTLPRRVIAIPQDHGYTLSQEPILSPLRKGLERSVKTTIPAVNGSRKIADTISPLEIMASFDPSDAVTFGLRILSDDHHWTEIGFDRRREIVFVDRTYSGKNVAKDFPARTETSMLADLPLNLHIVIDRSSVEVFAQNGVVAMTNLVFPHTSRQRIEVFRIGGHSPLHLRGGIWKLQSSWTSHTN